LNRKCAFLALKQILLRLCENFLRDAHRVARQNFSLRETKKVIHNCRAFAVCYNKVAIF